MLSNLNELVQPIAEQIRRFDSLDCELPSAFKNSVTKIGNNRIDYGRNSACATNTDGQRIFISNSLFFIAAILSPLYDPFTEYRNLLWKIVPKELLKTKDREAIRTSIEDSDELDEAEKNLLIKFATEPQWWNGGRYNDGKSLDRGDCLNSAILAIANVVNVAQGYIADLWEFLGKNPKYAALLNVAKGKYEAATNTTPLQTIYFGSPGTGKSHKVKTDVLKEVPEEQIFRTTFHPDSDYASFVGCYKPVCHSTKPLSDRTIDYDRLVTRLRETLGEHPSNLTAAFALFGFECRESILDMEKSGEHTISKLVEDAYKPNTTYDTTIRAGMQIKEETAVPETSRISYEFSPQVFTKAYCKAWKNPDRLIYLVIEEINRGNCAQIFGDLFQLLDRKDGVSEYPIDADTDLRLYLETELAKAEDGETDGSRGIEGGKLSLPSNLNILATMNTSDQSLFPMDSAFKRRWEWKYIPTAAPKGKDRQMELAIENTIETKDGRKINAGNYEYSWKDFLSKINDKILNVTHSEDKQLGYWFVKPDDGTDNISIGSFVSKVVFYLWNDVFKDMGARDTNPFTIKVNGKNELMSFNSFFEENTEGEVVENLGVLHTFLANVGLTPEPVNPGTASANGIESDAADEAENGDGASGETEG